MSNQRLASLIRQNGPSPLAPTGLGNDKGRAEQVVEGMNRIPRPLVADADFLGGSGNGTGFINFRQQSEPLFAGSVTSFVQKRQNRTNGVWYLVGSFGHGDIKLDYITTENDSSNNHASFENPQICGVFACFLIICANFLFSRRQKPLSQSRS
nr:hypothetical protein [uncultured Cohaesibacter sp.]